MLTIYVSHIIKNSTRPRSSKVKSSLLKNNETRAMCPSRGREGCDKFTIEFIGAAVVAPSDKLSRACWSPSCIPAWEHTQTTS